MTDGLWLWGPLGLFALHFSGHLWKKARSGHRIDLFELLLPAGSGYLAWTYGGDLWSEGLWLQAVMAALWWCAASPAFGMCQ